MATVFVVDDDASYLAAISRSLRASGYSVRKFASPSEFFQNLPVDESGCVVADLQMPGLSGLDLQAALAKTRNPLPVVFLTGHGDIPSSVSAMRHGAEDFLTKAAPHKELINAVERALARDSRERAKRRRHQNVRTLFGSLTVREAEVLEHVLRGQMNKEIAAELKIHERTVKLHRTGIMTKLGVNSVAELTRLAMEAGVWK